jgi:hypothetical protein
MKIKRINNVKVRAMKTPNDLDDRPTRGKDMIAVDYANIYCCAKKKTGKSTVVNQMVRKFAGPQTSVHIFCSTVHIDPTYIALTEYLERKGIPVYTSTSIKDDDGFDSIADLLKIDEDFMGKKDDDDDDDKDPALLDLDEKPPKEKKPRKSKYKELRRIFVLDDLSHEIRTNKSLIQLMKANRHYFYKTIIASQYVNDLQPQSINMLDYVILFKGHNDEKITELHKKIDSSIPLPKFIEIYRTITKDKHKFDFMYISRFDEVRRNFSDLIMWDE